MRLSAFISPTPLSSSLFITRSSSVSSRIPHRQYSRFTMQNPLPNFDEIAKQLSKELQVRRSVEPDDGISHPPTDAPPEEQPIHLTAGNNDMPMLILRHAPSAQKVEIYLYGAAVTSWTTKGEDHFWLSENNKWVTGGKAIRGGIPICFPQFGPYGDLVQHGFARISEWKVKESEVAEDGSVTATFSLDSETGGEEVAKWPHKFVAEYTVTLSFAGLETKLSVTNTDDKPFEFTCAFHNYFKVTSVSNARVFGYEGVKAKNRVNNDEEMPPLEDTGSGFLITEETDRIFGGTPDELAIFDFTSLKVLKVKKTPTLPDATLWNPFGAEGADPGWNGFICIEPANINTPTVLKPGETWMGAQLLGVE